MAIVLGFAEVLPSDTKIFINDIQVPIQAIYTAETGFSPQPGTVINFPWPFLGT